MITMKRFAAVIAALALGSAVTTEAASITLQQGLNGYSGCIDSFINSGGFLDDQCENFGLNPFLTVNSSQFNAG